MSDAVNVENDPSRLPDPRAETSEERSSDAHTVTQGSFSPVNPYPWELGLAAVLPLAQAHNAERIAQRFHETYERLAPSFGYSTREASAKPWADVPVENRRLMIAVADEIASWLDVTSEFVPYASQRLRLAIDALINTGYFTPDQVGDDVAPRIVELWAAKRHDLDKMIDEVRDLNAAKGWRDEERSFGDLRGEIEERRTAGPRRGDAVAEWLKANRDDHEPFTEWWKVTNALLGDYRMHADTGTSLDRPVKISDDD